MTFSIVARDEATGDFGVAVQSRFLGVGAVVPTVFSASGNTGRTPVASATASINSSALNRRGMACEKFSASFSFHSLAAMPAW